MNWDAISTIAEVIAAVGVIASLLFVAYELRRNTGEVRRTNWESTVDRFNTLWSRTGGDDLADVEWAEKWIRPCREPPTPV